MEYVLVILVSLFASGLTFFSGFGLGTILLPVFALFFPLQIAISATAIVHLLNNLFKLLLTYSSSNTQIVLRFGIPALIAAFAGAYCLSLLSQLNNLWDYEWLGRVFQVSPVKLVIAVLILFFSLMEILPGLRHLEFDKKYLPLGGLLSGFFGGLSGNQGALRSAFLIRAGLSKEAFIASGVVIACMIDVSRLSVYSGNFQTLNDQRTILLMVSATLSAFTGAYLGNKLIKKITLKSLQTLVTGFLVIFSLLLGSGII
jgi:uncharacterized protein